MQRQSEQVAPGGGKLSPQRLELLMGQLGRLPTLPAVAARLMALSSRDSARDEQAAMANIAELAACDPALTTRLLCLAQAAGRPARSAAQAVAALGLEAARSAALSVRVYDAATENIQDAIDLAEFWRHCLAVAAATEMLAEKLHLPLASDEAFACGLLHDLGKLALLAMLPKSYARVLAAVRLRDGNIADHEREILGIEHAVAGRRLAEHWQLDENIRAAIWMHHQPIEAIPTALDRRLPAVVSLADTLARQQTLGFSGNYTFPRSAAEQAAMLQLPAADLDDVAERLAGRLQQCEDLLGLAHVDGESLYRQALAGANAELGQLNERLRQRATQLDWQAEAFRRLRDFADGITDRATVPDVLRQVARIVSADGDQPDAGTVVAYAIDAEAGEVLLLRWDPTAEPRWRALPCREDFCPTAVMGEHPATAMSGLINECEELAAWVDLDACEHLPLRCAGRWVGGALRPTGEAPARREALEALAGAMAMALAIVQGRCNAIAMTEQLAGASQILAETQDALAEAKAISAVVAMAAGAAHEMNTPLAVISGRAQLMRERSGDPQNKQTWELISDQTQRISDILSSLMEFASPATPQPEALDAAKLLTEAQKLAGELEQLQGRPISVDIDVAEGLSPVWADEGQIRSAVVELIANAAAAGGTEPIVLAARPGDAGGVLFSVTDRGRGMDPKTLEQAFTPFFSAQQAGRRCGLGLPRVRRHVEINDGRVWIATQSGQGTTVYLLLPTAN